MMVTSRAGWLCALAFACACGTPPAAPPAFEPDRFELSAEGAFEVGAASRVLTPMIRERMTLDRNGDFEYHAADGDLFADVNGNGIFDAVWIAGYGRARPAIGVRDDVWARAIVLRQGGTTLAIVAVDFVGYMYDEVERIREALPAALGIDHLVVNATHNHQGPDTVGIWGPDDATSGLDLTYNAWVRAQIIDALTEAVGAVEPARVTYGQIHTDDHPTLGFTNYMGDRRDPIIVDDRLTVAHFTRPGDGTTIATLVHWASHTEYAGDENWLITSDYVHYLREGVERGIPIASPPLAGVGGTTVVVNGAVGGQIGPGGVQAIDLLGVPHPRLGHDKAEATGTNIAAYVLNLLDPASGLTETDATMRLGFRSKVFLLPIRNRAYHTALQLNIFDRATYDWDRTRWPSETNVPKIRTEAAVLTLGRIEVVTCPGEAFTEQFIGCYDGACTGPIWPLVDPMNPNPPDLTRAPGPPYLRDLMRGEYNILFGLANDEVGYIVPTYDFQLSDRNPYYDEPPGDHYEETNSTGPDAEPVILGVMTDLVRWQHPAP